MFIVADEIRGTISMAGLSYDQLFLIEHALINLAVNSESNSIKCQCEEIVKCIDATTEGLIGRAESY